MTDPYMGEVRIFGFGFAPRGWAQCNGALLSISQYTALFSILGTHFGGNGTTNFGLPNFTMGRTVLGAGAGPGLSDRSLGETGGTPSVTLRTGQVPGHGHTMKASSTPANVSAPAPSVMLAKSKGAMAYAPLINQQALDPGAVSAAPAGSQPHNNLMPYQVLNYCINLDGRFPPRE